MNKKKIELQVLNISNSQAQAGAYAMVLGEINGMRQLPVIIGSAEAQSMMIEMRGIVPPRPLTHTLFASVLKVLGATLLRVLIYKVDNGVFYSYLYMKTEEPAAWPAMFTSKPIFSGSAPGVSLAPKWAFPQ